MAKLQVGYINYGDTATLSGGNWNPNYPLTKLQQYGLSYPARSVDATLASTKFDIDLGADKVTRLIGVMGHNMTQDALARITGGDTPGATTYDSGWLNVWQPVYGAYDIPFESDGWWLGRLSAAEAALYRAKSLHDTGSNRLYRYWRVELNDTANPLGYIDLYRLYFGPLTSPTVNYSWGAAFGIEPRDSASETLGGARYPERRAGRRVFKWTVDALTDQEAFGWWLDMMNTLGSEGEVLVIPDPADISHRHRLDIWGRVRSWSDGVSRKYTNTQSASAIVEELL